MSQNFSAQQPARGGARANRRSYGSGSAASGISELNDTQLHSPYAPTPERETVPFGSTDSPQPIAVPKEIPSQVPSSLTAFMGQEEGDETLYKVQEGYGPRLVILWNVVSGPNKQSFQRGDVIWVSQLLGDEIMKDETRRSTELRRYMMGNNPAVREANRDEAKATKVIFLEGEEQLASSYQQAQAVIADVQNDNERLRQLIVAAGGDPDAEPNMQTTDGDVEDLGQANTDFVPVAPVTPPIPPTRVQQSASPLPRPISPSTPRPTGQEPVGQPATETPVGGGEGDQSKTTS